MKKYLVTWVIDVEEDDVITPMDAAKKAWKLRNNKGSIANVFTVTDKETGASCNIDLHLKIVQPVLVDKNAKIKNEMGNYLSNDEEDYDVLINRLKRLLKNGNGDLSLDGTTGIEVWEKVEGRFTVKEFCDLVGIK